jgi:hypothetical protein
MRWLSSVLFLIPVITGSVRGQEIPRREIFFAFFAKGIVFNDGLITENFQTEFILANPGSRSTQITIQFFSKDGTQLQIPLERDRVDLEEIHVPAPNPFQLGAQSSASVSISPVGALTFGWVRIESAEPITALEGLHLSGCSRAALPYPFRPH